MRRHGKGKLLQEAFRLLSSFFDGTFRLSSFQSRTDRIPISLPFGARSLSFFPLLTLFFSISVSFLDVSFHLHLFAFPSLFRLDIANLSVESGSVFLFPTLHISTSISRFLSLFRLHIPLCSIYQILPYIHLSPFLRPHSLFCPQKPSPGFSMKTFRAASAHKRARATTDDRRFKMYVGSTRSAYPTPIAPNPTPRPSPRRPSHNRPRHHTQTCPVSPVVACVTTPKHALYFP